MASDVTKMTRLVKIVSLLRQNVYPNHKTVENALRSLDVAGVYNVSQKTIQRDVQYLRDMYRRKQTACRAFDVPFHARNLPRKINPSIILKRKITI